MQIGQAVLAIHKRIALGVDGTELSCPLGIADVDCPSAGKELPITAIACRHDTVEHIHASGNVL